MAGPFVPAPWSHSGRRPSEKIVPRRATGKSIPANTCACRFAAPIDQVIGSFEGAKREIAWNLHTLGASLATTGQLEAVEALLLEGIAVGRESGDVTP